jgi:hypothetical protein
MPTGCRRRCISDTVDIILRPSIEAAAATTDTFEV